MIHYDFKKGTKLFVITKQKTYHIGRYVETTTSHLVLDNQKILLKNLRSSTIYKEQNGGSKCQKKHT